MLTRDECNQWLSERGLYGRYRVHKTEPNSLTGDATPIDGENNESNVLHEGKIQVFDLGWDGYIDRLENYFLSCPVPTPHR